MSKSQDPGGVKVELPSDLLEGNWWQPSTWAAPEVTLSGASVVVLAFSMIIFSVFEEARLTFRLPIHPAIASGVVAVAAAWVLTVCGRRPGALLPRIWLLTITVLATAISLGILFGPRAVSPWAQAVIFSILLASVMVLPRLYRIQLVQLYAYERFAAVLFFLLLCIPLALFGSSFLVDRESKRLDSMAGELSAIATEIDRLAEYAWSDRLRDNFREAEGRLADFENLGVENALPDEYGWRAAIYLERDRPLIDASRAVIEALRGWVEGTFAGPALIETQLHRTSDGWVKRRDFSRQREIPLRFYRTFGEVAEGVRQRMDSTAAPGDVQELAAATIDIEEMLAERVVSMEGTWSNDWLAIALGDETAPEGGSHLSLPDILRASMTRFPEGIKPAEIWHLMSLSPDSANSLVRNSQGGCHRSMDGLQGGVDSFSLECESYRFSRGKLEMRAHLRLAFSGSPEGAATKDGPVELLYLFRVADERADGFENEVLGTLFEAARGLAEENRERIDFEPVRQGDPSLGFLVMVRHGPVFAVDRGRRVKLPGGQEGVEVRARHASPDEEP